MLTFEDLYRSHLSCRKGHRRKAEVLRFEKRLIENLLKIEKRLKNLSKYNIEYYSFEVREPKKRMIYATRYEFRIVNACICEKMLKPRLETLLLDQNMACRKGKGTHKAQRLMTQHLSGHFWINKSNNFYCLKCDIKSYFENINHDILKGFLNRIVSDKDTLALCDRIIDSYGSGVGIPLGNQTSQLFALLYLHPLDVLFESKGLKWVRYMDDFCIIHEDKVMLRELLLEVETYCKALKLQLNPKTQIFKVSKGFDFLSFKYHVSESGKVVRRIKKKSRKRIRSKIKQLQNSYSRYEIDGESLGRTYASYYGHLLHGHTYEFRRRVFNVSYQRGEQKCS